MIFDFLFKKPKIYCCSCGEEIESGGYVGGGKVYCNENNLCCMALALVSDITLRFEYETRKEILKGIKTGKIINGLEKSVKEKRR